MCFIRVPKSLFSRIARRVRDQKVALHFPSRKKYKKENINFLPFGHGSGILEIEINDSKSFFGSWIFMQAPNGQFDRYLLPCRYRSVVDISKIFLPCEKYEIKESKRILEKINRQIVRRPRKNHLNFQQ